MKSSLKNFAHIIWGLVQLPLLFYTLLFFLQFTKDYPGNEWSYAHFVLVAILQIVLIASLPITYFNSWKKNNWALRLNVLLTFLGYIFLIYELISAI